MTIQGIMWVVVSIIFLAVMSPIIYSFVKMIAGNATANGDTTSSTIANTLPTFLVLGVLVGIVIYAIAGRARGQEEG
jgi:putative exporter of polyketide antibiotics